MPETLEQDVNTETDSSSASDVQADSSSETSEQPKGQDVKEKTLADVVAETVAESDATSAKEKAAEEGALRSSEATEKGEDKEEVPAQEETEKEEEKLPFGEHPRWKEVLGERDEAKAKVQEYETRVKEWEPIVQAHKTVTDFLVQNDVSPEEMNRALQIAALVKTKPEEALKMLLPVVEGLQYMQGEKLPKDLEQAVAEGVMPAQYAKELSKLRSQGEYERRRNALTMEQMQKRQEESNAKATSDAIISWGEAHKRTDPDFKPKSSATEPDGKYEWFLLQLQGLVYKNPPRSPQEAVNLAEQAYDATCKSFSRFIPKVKPSKALPSNRSSTVPKKQPDNIRDVVAQTVAKYGITME